MPFAATAALTEFWAKCKAAFQDKLVSGTNIKTVNGESLLGSGDLTVAGGAADIRDASNTVSVATSTNTNVASITLPIGVWLVNSRLQYASNATGRRGTKLSTTSAESGNVLSTDVRNAVDGGTTQIQTERVFALTGESTVYLVGWQNSGSALSCTGEIQAVRIAVLDSLDMQSANGVNF